MSGLNNLLDWVGRQGVGSGGWGKADLELIFGHVKFEMSLRRLWKLFSYQWVGKLGLRKVTEI